jgi:serine protease inhibitor
MAARDTGNVFTNAAEGAKLSAANIKFALALYRYQASATAGNIFMSPLSISVALAMTYLGARNNTKSQMSDVLHFGEVEEAELHQAFSDIRLVLNRADQPYKLHMANRLFGEKTFKFLEEYLSASDKHYGAKLEPIDFM